MLLSLPEVDATQFSPSVNFSPEAAATAAGSSPSPIPAASANRAAVPAAAGAAPAKAKQKLWKLVSFGSKCLPAFGWSRNRKSQKGQQQQRQPQRQGAQKRQQKAAYEGLVYSQITQKQTRLQQQFQVQQLQEQQSHQEQQPKQQQTTKQQHMQQSQDHQKQRLPVLRGTSDTAGLTTPCIGIGSNSNSSGGKSSSRNNSSAAAGGYNFSTPGTPGYSSSGSNRSGGSVCSCSSNNGSSSSHALPHFSVDGTTSGPCCVGSSLSPRSLIFSCSSSSSSCCYNRGSNTNSTLLREGAAAARVAAGSGAGAANMVVRKTVEGNAEAVPSCCPRAAPLPSAVAAAGEINSAISPAADAAAAAGADTSIPAATAMMLPTKEMVEKGSAQVQLKAAAASPPEVVWQVKLRAAATALRIIGAANAADEWEGPDLFPAPSYKPDRNKPAEEQQQQPQQKQQDHQQRRKNLGGAVNRPMSFVSCGTEPLGASAAASTAPAAPAPAGKVASAGTAGSEFLPCPASWADTELKIPTSASVLQSMQPKKLRRHLEEPEPPTLPLLGGATGTAQLEPGFSFAPAAAAISREAEHSFGQCRGSDKESNSSNSNPTTVTTGGHCETLSTGQAAGNVLSAATSPDAADAVPCIATSTADQETAEENRDQEGHKQTQEQHQRAVGMTNPAMASVVSMQQEPKQLYQQQKKQYQQQSLCASPVSKDDAQQVHPPPSCASSSPRGYHAGHSTAGTSAAVAAVEIAATVVDVAAATAVSTVGPPAGALVSCVAQSLNALLTNGPPGCSIRTPRRQQLQQKQLLEQQLHEQQHQEQQVHQVRVQQQHETQLQRAASLLHGFSHSPHQLQQRNAQEEPMRPHFLHRQQLQHLGVQQELPGQPAPSSSPSTANLHAYCALQQPTVCGLHQRQQQQYQLQQQQHEPLLQRKHLPAPHGPPTGTYATTRAESPRRLQQRFLTFSKQKQLQQQQQQRHQMVPRQTQQQQEYQSQQQQNVQPQLLVEKPRTFFGVHLSAEAEAAAANAAGAAAAAAEARPISRRSSSQPLFPVSVNGQQQQQQQDSPEVKLPEASRQQHVQRQPVSVNPVHEDPAGQRHDPCNNACAEGHSNRAVGASSTSTLETSTQPFRALDETLSGASELALPGTPKRASNGDSSAVPMEVPVETPTEEPTMSPVVASAIYGNGYSVSACDKNYLTAASGRLSPAGKQAAEASRRAMLLRKNSQASLIQICGAANQEQQQLQMPDRQLQQQARWETAGNHSVPLAAAAAAEASTTVPQQKQAAFHEAKPHEASSSSTHVCSGLSTASSSSSISRSALTPQLPHPSRRAPFRLQQPTTATDLVAAGPFPSLSISPSSSSQTPSGASGVAGAIGPAGAAAERPSTPVRAERLRKHLEQLKERGELRVDNFPAAEVAALIRNTKVEREGPFQVYVLDKEWKLGCSKLDKEWPLKMLQNTKEGIKLHREINKLIDIAKQIQLQKPQSHG